ncbi:MAG TPA: putative metal-dependent hydrolase [Planctomycetota bacterium]|nr:putative metal-dependent hydrolase [Planctomycetota bacterium]
MDLRYPIGPPVATPPTPAARRNHLKDLAGGVTLLRQAVKGLTPVQLDTPYRPGGWTLRQVVHHLPDSHMNGYIRCRMALTEDLPRIKTYDEGRWAELEDARLGPLEVSFRLLDAIHLRWGALFRSLTEDDWKRAYVHPEDGKTTLDGALALYAWHLRHHTAHITSLRGRMSWA